MTEFIPITKKTFQSSTNHQIRPQQGVVTVLGVLLSSEENQNCLENTQQTCMCSIVSALWSHGAVVRIRQGRTLPNDHALLAKQRIYISQEPGVTYPISRTKHNWSLKQGIISLTYKPKHALGKNYWAEFSQILWLKNFSLCPLKAHSWAFISYDFVANSIPFYLVILMPYFLRHHVNSTC
jgi:hypothetical protein